MRVGAFAVLLAAGLSACSTGSSTDPRSLSLDAAEPAGRAFLLSNIRQLTFEGRRSKEGYFSADGGRLVFQSERDLGNPFYQTYILDLTSGRAARVSPGVGRTTRGFFHPLGHRVIFDSTHAEADARAEQADELEERRQGDPDRFVWDFDPDLDVYVIDLGSRRVDRLTETRGYDAEAAFSPDGKWIVFSSNRAAYDTELDRESQERLEIDPSYFVEIYLMRSDGTEVRRLTHREGYDGGPVFSPDGKQIAWRRFEPEDGTAELYTMAVDGQDVRQITEVDQTSWAAFYHPSGDYLIFSSNRHGVGNYELYVVDVRGASPAVRVTQAGGYDGLPAFSPDGRWLSWTGRHADSMLSQIFVADWNDAEARRRLGLGSARALRPVGPGQPRAERASDPPSDPTAGRGQVDPGGIEDPVDQTWTGRHIFSLTRGLSRSALKPVVRAPLYLVTVPVDVVLLPWTALLGFFD